MAQGKLIGTKTARAGFARRLFWPLALLLLALLPVAAQAATTDAQRPEVPALWEVQSGKSRAYLFGTVHSLPRGVDWFKPHVARALDQSKLLVLETEIPDTPAGISPVVMKLSRLSSARPVPDRVPESWRPTLMQAVNRLQPGPMEWHDTWYISLMLTNLQSQQDGLDPRIGAEAVLSERARMRNIPIKGLETVEEQLTNFDALPEADQQMMLMSTLEDLDQSKAKMSLLIGDWMLGDTDALASRINSEFQRSPMLRRLLVEDRNVRWADWIARTLQADEGPIFVAVGAGHLAGKASVIEELQKRGLKVQRVSPETVQPERPKRRRRG